MTEAVRIPGLVSAVDRAKGHHAKKRAFDIWYSKQGQAPPGQPPKKRRREPAPPGWKSARMKEQEKSHYKPKPKKKPRPLPDLVG